MHLWLLFTQMHGCPGNQYLLKYILVSWLLWPKWQVLSRRIFFCGNFKRFEFFVYHILLQYGLPHVIIMDLDSIFERGFKGCMTLLKQKYHLVARDHHNMILVEHFMRLLNSGMLIFVRNHGTVKKIVGSSLLLAYTWNAAPIVWTNLSRSLLVVRREFRFPRLYW